MKHLFTIHSPITYFSAISIIFQENIPHDEVIIISSGYKVPLEIGNVVESYQNYQNSIWEKLKRVNVVKGYDEYIEIITGGAEFIAYIDLMHAYQRIIVTNDKCLSFNFMEEGTASYVKPDSLYLITHGFKNLKFRNKNFKQLSQSLIRILRGTNIRLLSLPFQPLAYSFLPNIKYYTFSEFAYPGVDSKKKIKLKVNNIYDSFLNHFELNLNFDNSVMWVEETFPKYYGVADKDYCEAILQVLEVLKKNAVTEIFFKLRPNRKVEDSLLYSVIYNSDIKVTLIPNQLVAEVIFIKAQNIKVIGIVSSLLFYATIFGHESYSFFNLLKSKPTTPFDAMEFYWKAVGKVSNDLILKN